MGGTCSNTDDTDDTQDIYDGGADLDTCFESALDGETNSGVSVHELVVLGHAYDRQLHTYN